MPLRRLARDPSILGRFMFEFEDDKINPFTAEHQHILRSEPITLDGPGTILHDFGAMLRLIGIEGVEAGGEMHLLPMRLLADLNAALREPLRIDMQRAQLRSYPNLQALYLLGRAAGLIMPLGGGTDARLAVDPELLRQWLDFNPVEQYCTLLDAWLVRVDPEIIGEGRAWETPATGALRTWKAITAKGIKVSRAARGASNPYQSLRFDRLHTAFLWLFGLIAVEQGTPLPKKMWVPAGMKQKPFGEAMLTLIGNNLRKIPPYSRFDVDEHSDPDSNESDENSLNELQPILQPYFPGWTRSLTIPDEEFRDGTYIFKVILNKIWRRIAIAATATWDDLGDAIQRSVGFDDDNLWAFTWVDRFGSKLNITRQTGLDDADADGIAGDELRIGDLPLRIGEPMQFISDFGDDWRFEVILEQVNPPDPKFRTPKVIEKHGKAPKQYDWE